MVLAPELSTLFRQQLLVDFADLLKQLAHAGEVIQLPPDRGDLRGMEADLASLGSGVVDVEDPLQMALALGAGGAGNRRRMEGVAFEE